jgi:hypothetical protein
LSGAVAVLQLMPQLPQLPLSVWVLTQTVLFPLPQSFGRLPLLQVATQLAPEHAKVPFAGDVGQVAHALLQSIVPAAQLVHMLPLQLVPVGQTWPQLPQLFLSSDVLISQPLAALPSQLAIGALHVGCEHVPLTHVSVPPVMLQTCPHEPQLLTSVLMLVSQPLLATPSQSRNPVRHAVTAQLLEMHPSTAWLPAQTFPQLWQLEGSVLVFTQVEPHNVAPLQVWPHLGGVPEHVGMAPAPLGGGHAMQVVPQEPVDTEVSGTHVPLQLCSPDGHLQTELWQVMPPVQVVPHLPQLF